MIDQIQVIHSIVKLRPFNVFLGLVVVLFINVLKEFIVALGLLYRHCVVPQLHTGLKVSHLISAFEKLLSRLIS